jgi:hypothetical protein
MTILTPFSWFSPHSSFAWFFRCKQGVWRRASSASLETCVSRFYKAMSWVGWKCGFQGREFWRSKLRYPKWGQKIGFLWGLRKGVKNVA